MVFKIKIVAVGKIKNHQIATLCQEYQKRLAPFCKLQLVELPASPFLRASDKKKAQDQEGKKILAYLKKNQGENFWLLDEAGKEYTSVAFAEKLTSFSGCITFVIAGSLGFSQEIKQLPLPRMALSQLTFPHELARLLLYEQLYRAISILNKKQYHY